jgi:peptidyl-prolyl cis-trans isomerase C
MDIREARKIGFYTSFLAIFVALSVHAQPQAKPAARAAQKPSSTGQAAAEGPGKIVLKVGSHSYTQADMEFLIHTLDPQLRQVVERQGPKPLGDQYATMAILSQQAEKDKLDSSKEFGQQMALQRLQALAQAEYEKMADEIKVSPEEISQYYTAHSTDYDQAQVREFIIRKRAGDAKEDDPGLPPLEAKARADEIRKALIDGTDPKTVAEKFNAANAVMADAEPRSIRRRQLVAALDKAAFELKEGEVSEPLETPQALAFIQVVGHSRPELKDVSTDIENSLHQEKLQLAVDNLKGKTTIWMDEGYFKAPVGAAGSMPPAEKP